MTAKLTILFGILLILAVACGTAEAPDPTAAPAGEPTAAPAISEASQPTAALQAADPPVEAEVNPGNLSIMVADFSDEQFGAVFGGGSSGEHNYLRIMGGYLISENENKEMIPGIAREWDFSSDGLTWNFTIREGAKFHDGSEITSRGRTLDSSVCLWSRG
jgi:ABC-type transport system substrate-binding protein